MKQQLFGSNRPSGAAAAAAAFSFQEELAAAIHGAFEVAVEIAVRDVKKLAGQATSDIYAELRRENESLKERLRRAEAALEARGCRRVAPRGQRLAKTKHAAPPPPHPDGAPSSPYPAVGSGRSCAAAGGADPQPSDPQDKHTCPNEEPRSNLDCDNEAPSNPETEQSDHCIYNEVAEQLSQACVVKLESLNASCHKPGETLQLPSKSSLEQVTIKQEQLEDTINASPCCVDSIKLEDFSLEECLSPVQSNILEQWKAVGPDSQSQDLNFQLSSAELDHVDSPVETTSICPDTDRLSSTFPNLFQGAEPAPTSEATPQVFGVYVRTSRHLNHSLHTCKSCGQAFHLPSLLRRHNGQCQQRLQQRCQQPVAGGKRTRLQLYPPGCSPFRCTVCNREFNRLENLKTHLRIHTGERPYTCSVCSKCFRHSGALTRHFRIHTGEKPYICGQCGKSFRNCGGLKFHQRSHNRQLQ